MKRSLSSIRYRLGTDKRFLPGIHVVCLLICSSLGFGCFYFASRPNEILYEYIDLPMPIEEAERLVASATSWKSGLQEEQQRELALMHRATQVTQWLPYERDWSHSMQAVQQLAERCNVELIEMAPGEEFTGERVKVQTAVCQLGGTFAEVCRFLGGLPQLESPVWASEMTMELDSNAGKLTVVAHLRFPFAGQETAGSYVWGLVRESQLAKTPPIASETAVALRLKESDLGY